MSTSFGGLSSTVTEEKDDIEDYECISYFISARYPLKIWDCIMKSASLKS